MKRSRKLQGQDGLLFALVLSAPLVVQAQISVYDPGGSAAIVNSTITNSILVQQQTRIARDAAGASGSSKGKGSSGLASVSGKAFSAPSTVKPATGLASVFGKGGGGASAAAFDYTPSADVSRSVRQELSAEIAKTNPSQAGSVQQALYTDQIWREFNRLLGSFGYSGTNLADVMTAYYIINWEVVNGADASRNRAGIQAVHDQLTTALLSDPKVAGLGDVDKQRAAEGLGLMAAVAGGAKNELVKSGDRAGLAQLQSAVHQSVLQQGIDLKRLKLTAQGFVAG